MVNNPELSIENDPDISFDIQNLENPEGELHLRFYLASGKEFAIGAMGIAEVMQHSPDDIAPIPNASPILLGTVNLRGKIIWVADLGQFLGDSGNLTTDKPTIPIIAIETEELILGLAVEKIGDIDWLDVENLENTTSLPDLMTSFVSGQWRSLEGTEEFLNLLDYSKILYSTKWTN